MSSTHALAATPSSRAQCFLDTFTRSPRRDIPNIGLDHDECPICLDPHIDNEEVQVKIAGCNHVIGRACLISLIDNAPNAEKKCPLCRTVWMPANDLLVRSQRLQNPSELQDFQNEMRHYTGLTNDIQDVRARAANTGRGGLFRNMSARRVENHETFAVPSTKRRTEQRTRVNQYVNDEVRRQLTEDIMAIEFVRERAARTERRPPPTLRDRTLRNNTPYNTNSTLAPAKSLHQSEEPESYQRLTQELATIRTRAATSAPPSRLQKRRDETVRPMQDRRRDLDQRERDIKQCQHEIDQRVRSLNDRMKWFAQQERRVAEQARELREWETKLKEDKLNERDAKIKEKEDRLKEKETLMNRRYQTWETRIQENEKAVLDREKRANNILATARRQAEEQELMRNRHKEELLRIEKQESDAQTKEGESCS